MRCTRLCHAPQVEAAQALGVGVLEALAAGGAQAQMAQRVGNAIVLARQAAAAADASLLRCSAAAPAAAGGAGPIPAAAQQQQARCLQLPLLFESQIEAGCAILLHGSSRCATYIPRRCFVCAADVAES